MNTSIIPPRGLLNTLSTFVKDNGLIVITMPNSVSLYKRLKVIIGLSNYHRIEIFYNSPDNDWRGHVREYTKKEAEYICSENGFQVLFSKTFEAIAYEKILPLLRPIYLFLTKVIPNSGSFILLICKKNMDGYQKNLMKNFLEIV